MTIFTNGKFDLLHSGHFNLLMFCRKLAGPTGEVIVAIDIDERITRDNGTPPAFNYVERIYNLKILRCESGHLIDKVLIFTTDEDLQLILKVNKPDFMVKGSEWRGKNILGSELVPWPVIFYESEPNASNSNKISSSDIAKTLKTL